MACPACLALGLCRRRWRCERTEPARGLHRRRSRSRASIASVAPSRACSKPRHGSFAKASTAASSPATTRGATHPVSSSRSTACSASRWPRARSRAFVRTRPRSRPTPAGSVEALPRHPRDRRAGRSDANAAPTWRDTLTMPRLEPEIVLREREAATVARRIVARLRGGASPGDIFVLCRKRETLRLVAAALEREHVAHSAVEDTTLASTPGGAGPDRRARRDRLAGAPAVARPSAAQPSCSAPATPICSRSPLRRRPQATRTGGERWRRWRRRARRCARARRIAPALARRGGAAPAARPARPHRRRGRTARTDRRRRPSRAARPGARRDRRGARPGASARRRPLCDAVRLRACAEAPFGQERAAAACRRGQAADRPWRKGARSRHGVRHRRRSRAAVDRDDDAARRLAGRGRAPAALRVHVLRVALSAVARDAARRRTGGTRARGAERPLRRHDAGQARAGVQRHRAVPGAGAALMVAARRAVRRRRRSGCGRRALPSVGQSRRCVAAHPAEAIGACPGSACASAAAAAVRR